MKKIIVLILIFLPIFLMISISFAGRIFSVISFIQVESVVFVDKDDEEINTMIKTPVNVPLKIKSKVLPELATNKNVSYAISPAGMAEFNAEGELVAEESCVVTVIVTTENMKKTNQIQIHFTAEFVSSVSINVSELELNVKDRCTLIETVLPSSALNKNVMWTSSAPHLVDVTMQGVVNAKAVTPENEPVVITVTTIDGNFSATCTVVVKEGLPNIVFIDPPTGSVYQLAGPDINLMSVIEYNELVNPQDIRLEIVSGSDFASITNNVLTITGTGKYIKVKAYIIGMEQYFTEMLFIRQ